MLKPKQKTLADRITEFRSELDALLDKKAAELKVEHENVPLQSLRLMLCVRFGDCQCAAALSLLEKN